MKHFFLLLVLTFNAALHLRPVTAVVTTTGDGNKILALLDNQSIKETHSAFFKSLTEMGFDVTFKVADDPSIVLKKYGDFVFDHLILFSPSVEEFGGQLSVEAIVEFVDHGGNVLAAGNERTGDVLREIAAECGFEADEENTAVIDHLNFDQNLDSSGKHTVIVADPENLIKAEAVVGKNNPSPFLYKGKSSNGSTVDIG